MPTRKLTDLFAERVKAPAKGRIEYFDAAFGSLALRVTSAGHKSWSLFYRTGGRLVFEAFADARVRAKNPPFDTNFRLVPTR